MYLNYYQFQKEPFLITPDPSFLYLSPCHREALATIVYGVERKLGIILITGDVGTGKTTLVRSYLETSDRIKVKPVYIFNPDISFQELLRVIFEELNLQTEARAESEMVRILHRHLIEEYRNGHTVVVILDEAQNTPIETLEKLRLLSNLETHSEKLIQILLVGQNNLEDIIHRDDLRQLNQRITIRAKIDPLSYREAKGYIQHRLAQVGGSENLFTYHALRNVIEYSKGIPRVMNVVCHNALIAGFSYQRKRISSSLVQDVIRDVEGRRKGRLLRWSLAAGLALALTGAIGAASVSWRDVLDVRRLPFRLQASVSETLPSMKTAAAGETNPKTTRETTRNESSVLPTPTLVSPEDALSALPEPRNEVDRILWDPLVYQDRTLAVPSGNETAEEETPRDIRRVIQKGDNLSRLLLEIFGEVNQELIDEFRRNNPHITDVNYIKVGEIARFPVPSRPVRAKEKL